MPLRDPNYRPPAPDPRADNVVFGVCGLLILTVAVALPYLSGTFPFVAADPEARLEAVKHGISQLRAVVAVVGSIFTAISLAGWFAFPDDK